MVSIRLHPFAALLCAVLWTAPGAAATYVTEPLRIAGVGPVGASGITAGGVIFGAFRAKSGVVRAYTLSNGTARIYDVGKARLLEVEANDSGGLAGLEILGDFDDLYRLSGGRVRHEPARVDQVLGLDNEGDLIGTGDGPTGNRAHGFGVEWLAGAHKTTRYKVAGSTGTFFTRINSPGTIAGFYTTHGGREMTGFILASGQMTPVLVPGYTQSAIWDINDNGSLVVWARNADGTAGDFIDVGGTFTQISPPNAVLVNVQGINDRNLAYGMYETADEIFHPFVFSAGVYTTFNAPKGTQFNLYGLLGMDTAGTLVGYSLKNTYPVAFTATCHGTGC